MDEKKLSKEIYNHAMQCGFDKCGIISIDALNGFEDFLEKRISNVPQSKFFYENIDSLGDVKERFPKRITSRYDSYKSYLPLFRTAYFPTAPYRNIRKNIS